MRNIVPIVRASRMAYRSHQFILQFFGWIHRISGKIDFGHQLDLGAAGVAIVGALDLDGDDVGWGKDLDLACNIDEVLAVFAAIALNVVFHVCLNKERHLLATEMLWKSEGKIGVFGYVWVGGVATVRAGYRCGGDG